MDERQQIAFDRRGQTHDPNRDQSYVHKRGSAKYVSRIIVMRFGQGWAWHARVGKVGSNGHAEKLNRIGKAELARMRQIGANLLHGTGEAMQIAVRAEDTSYSFMKPFNMIENQMVKDSDDALIRGSAHRIM